MKLDTLKSGNNLMVLLSVYNPASDAAEDPTNATANFYQLTGAGLVVHPSLPTTPLAQQGGMVGVWGAFIPTAGATLSDVVVVVTALVGGVTRTVVKPLGYSGIGSVVGAPRITTTPGPVVDNSKP